MHDLAEAFELTNTHADLNVLPEEYVRLLGYPRGWTLEGRALELADWARDWYAKNGRPWFYARQAENFKIRGDSIHIDGSQFTSKRMQATLQRAEAHSVILVAVGAGSEAEEESRRRWEDGKPDEYFFLEVFGSAVVEHLTASTGARLCEWAEKQEMAVLPHYSPGYPEWDIAEQPRFFFDASGHQLDSLFWITGLKPVQVQARMDNRGTPVPISYISTSRAAACVRY